VAKGSCGAAPAPPPFRAGFGATDFLKRNSWTEGFLAAARVPGTDAAGSVTAACVAKGSWAMGFGLASLCGAAAPGFGAEGFGAGGSVWEGGYAASRDF
jgi:hypothetical protein